MSSKFLAELSSDYEKFFETEIGYDVIIYVGEDQNVKEIHAHSNILCARSQYFRSEFSNERVEKKDGKFIFRKPNISPQLFNIILRFIYCGNIELKNLQGPDVLKLLMVVDELYINSLVIYIQEFLIEHQTEFLNQSPIEIFEIIYQHEKFTDLWNFCLKKVCNEPKILFDSEKFIKLKAPLLELLLKREDLNMDEIEIWENISTAKLGYVNKTNVAVYCEYNYGPSMGNLFCKNNRWYTNSSDNGDRYPRIGIPERFDVEDYEVFQLIKK
ncbi:unnamed protein product [Rhizophagus irregularis]|nr:unnamed protein product [Rhizophagus irregularis]